MKLYLGSYRIADPDSLESLVGRPLEGLNTAIIGNAKDAKSDEERSASLRQVHRSLGLLGLATTDIDLRDISEAAETMETVSIFDMVFVTGGNSFVLRERMRSSGFDTAINLLADSNLVYCGESAGAVVAGTTIASADVEDMSKVSEPIYEGLGLIDRVIVPHANWKRRVAYIEKMQAIYGERILTLTDDQTHTVS